MVFVSFDQTSAEHEHRYIRQAQCISCSAFQCTYGRCCTLDAKTREERVSGACAGEGDRLAIISALASPPSESCSSMVSLEFLHAQQALCVSCAESTAVQCSNRLLQHKPTEGPRDLALLPFLVNQHLHVNSLSPSTRGPRISRSSPVGDVRGVLHERGDDVAQLQQAAIDVLRLRQRQPCTMVTAGTFITSTLLLWLQACIQHSFRRLESSCAATLFLYFTCPKSLWEFHLLA